MRKRRLLAALVCATMLTACTYTGAYRDEGWSKIVAEDYAGARDHYLAVLAERPGNPWANLNLGVAYEKLGQRELARQHYELAVRYGEYAEIVQVASDGDVTDRETTVAVIAADNLARLGT